MGLLQKLEEAAAGNLDGDTKQPCQMVPCPFGGESHQVDEDGREYHVRHCQYYRDDKTACECAECKKIQARRPLRPFVRLEKKTRLPFYRVSATGGREAVPLSYEGHGESIVLCCPGPSLDSWETANLNQPGIVTMAVNSAYKTLWSHGVVPTYWAGIDHPNCFSERAVLDARTMHFWQLSWWSHSVLGQPLSTVPRTYFFPSDRVKDPAEFFTAPYVVSWRNSFWAAIKIAYELGYRHLVFAGVDLHVDKHRPYSWGGSLTPNQVGYNQRVYNIERARLEEMAPYFKGAGVTVEVANPQCNLDGYPRRPLVDIVADLAANVPDDRPDLPHVNTSKRYSTTGEQRAYWKSPAIPASQVKAAMPAAPVVVSIPPELKDTILVLHHIGGTISHEGDRLTLGETLTKHIVDSGLKRADVACSRNNPFRDVSKWVKEHGRPTATIRWEEQGGAYAEMGAWQRLVRWSYNMGIVPLFCDFAAIDHYSGHLYDRYRWQGGSAIKDEWATIRDVLDLSAVPDYTREYMDRVRAVYSAAKEADELAGPQYVAAFGQLTARRCRLPLNGKGANAWRNKVQEVLGNRVRFKGHPAARDKQGWRIDQLKTNAELVAHAEFSLTNNSGIVPELLVAEAPVIATGRSWYHGLGVIDEPDSWDAVRDWTPHPYDPKLRAKYLNWCLGHQVLWGGGTNSILRKLIEGASVVPTC